MDLDEIRRKRIRLFENQSEGSLPAVAHHLQSRVAGERSALPAMNPSDQNADEAFARALQAQFDEGYNDSASMPPPLPHGVPFATPFNMPPPPSVPSHNMPPNNMPPYNMSPYNVSPYNMPQYNMPPRNLLPFPNFGFSPPAKLTPGATVIPGVPIPPPHAPHAPQMSTLFPKFWQSKKKAKATYEVKTAPIVAYDVDESADAVSVQAFALNAVFVPCACCQKAHSKSKSDIIELFEGASLMEGQSLAPGQVDFNFICESCWMMTCPGCGELLSARSEKFGMESKGLEFTWHCDRGRLALIWFLLCGYDSHVKHNKPQTITPENSAMPKRGRGSRSTGSGYSMQDYNVVSGVGYGGDDEYDYDSEVMDSPEDDYHEPAEDIGVNGDYDSDYDDISSYPQLRPGAAKRYKRSTSPIRVDPDDHLTARIMEALSVLLPCPKEQLVPTLFDDSPPVPLLCMLMRSSILDRAAELLRNDSLEDATRRQDVYDGLLSFLRTLTGNGNEMTKAVHDKRVVNKAGHDLLKVSFNEPTRLNGESVVMAPALASCMTDLKRQSMTMLKSGETNAAVFQTEDAQQMLLLCRNIVEVSDLVHATAIKETVAELTASTAVDTNVWCKELAVADVADDVILNSHYFKSEVDKMGKPPIGRMRHIIKEITALNTSLPPGIFVRHGESRLDVMKIVIIGPKGTPYENALFEFDLLCPSEYPGVPPVMQLKTTGGGAVGFNPNLYASGKVCLSLLGTWEGETWQPGKSTLLQVLVSIQAMIFCEEPWCNEPGREGMQGSKDSKRFNRGLYPNVVKYGMLEWLENKRSVVMPPRRKKLGPRGLGDGIEDIMPRVDAAFKANEIWNDVAKKHFEVKKEDIIKTVDVWVKDKPKESPMRKYDLVGTGWFGRTLGGNGSADAAAARPAISVGESELVSKLKGAMGQLESNARSRYGGNYGWAMPEDYE